MKLTRTSAFALLLMALAGLCVLAVFPCLRLFEDYHPAMRCYAAATVFSVVSGCLLVWDCLIRPTLGKKH